MPGGECIAGEEGPGGRPGGEGTGGRPSGENV